MSEEAALQAALAGAVERYRLKNPRSAAQFDAATRVMPGGNTRSVLFYEPFPLTMASGRGCYLTDLDGHVYLDLIGEFTAGLYGHSHPALLAAIAEAVASGLNLTAHTVREVELARLICERFPSIELVRFTNSGTEANLMAIALAKVHTGRERMMVFRGGYHGGVLTFANGASPVNVPHEWVYADYNDVAGTAILIREHGDRLAAVMVEPMLGAGGCIPGSAQFLSMLRAETKASGSLLIFDEVQTSRMGPGGRQGQLGIVPDLTALGKYLGGGSSFGALGGAAAIMERFDPRRSDALPHAGTFNNNVISMAAGSAGLREVFTPAEATRLHELGDSLRARLNACCKAHGAPMQWIGLGSVMNVHCGTGELTRYAQVRALPGELRDLLYFDLLEGGIYIARRGMVALSLPVGEMEAERFVSAFERFVARRKCMLAM